MTGNLHALFLCSWYPNRVEPTAGNFIQKHAEAVALYCKVSALSICSDARMLNDPEVEISELNGVFSVIVYYKKVDISIPIISQFIKAFKYYKAFKLGYKILLENRGEPQIIHVNIALPAGLLAVLIHTLKNIPFVITEHWTGYLNTGKKKLSNLEILISRYIFNKAACVMPVSQDLANALKNIGVQNSFAIVPNVVDVHTFFYSGKTVRIKKHLLHISTAKDEQKNISGLLRVIKKTSDLRHDFYLTIVSDGEVKAHVAYAASLNILNTFVYFEPTKSTEEVAAIMRQSDALVLFSNYENFPCVIPEALSSGLPVVSTNVNGIPEHINTDNGILVPAGNEVEMASALTRIIDMTVCFDPTLLREYAIKNFSYEAVGKRYFDVYCNVLKQSW